MSVQYPDLFPSLPSPSAPPFPSSNPYVVEIRNDICIVCGKDFSGTSEPVTVYPKCRHQIHSKCSLKLVGNSVVFNPGCTLCDRTEQTPASVPSVSISGGLDLGVQSDDDEFESHMISDSKVKDVNDRWSKDRTIQVMDDDDTERKKLYKQEKDRLKALYASRGYNPEETADKYPILQKMVEKLHNFSHGSWRNRLKEREFDREWVEEYGFNLSNLLAAGITINHIYHSLGYRDFAELKEKLKLERSHLEKKKGEKRPVSISALAILYSVRYSQGQNTLAQLGIDDLEKLTSLRKITINDLKDLGIGTAGKLVRRKLNYISMCRLKFGEEQWIKELGLRPKHLVSIDFSKKWFQGLGLNPLAFVVSMKKAMGRDMTNHEKMRLGLDFDTFLEYNK
jgi:hypothetical protein